MEEFKDCDEKAIRLRAKELKENMLIDIAPNGPLAISFISTASGQMKSYNMGENKLMARIRFEGIEKIKQILNMEDGQQPTTNIFNGRNIAFNSPHSPMTYNEVTGSEKAPQKKRFGISMEILQR